MPDEQLEMQLSKLNLEARKKIRRMLWLLEQDCFELSPWERKEAREQAGLTTKQAAKICFPNLPFIDAIMKIVASEEVNGVAPNPISREDADAMNKAYGIGV